MRLLMQEMELSKDYDVTKMYDSVAQVTANWGCGCQFVCVHTSLLAHVFQWEDFKVRMSLG